MHRHSPVAVDATLRIKFAGNAMELAFYMHLVGPGHNFLYTILVVDLLREIYTP